MTTKPSAILTVVFCTVLTSLGQLCFKIAVGRLSWNALALLTNWYLWAGFIIYFAGAGLLVLALKHGELSVLYPIIALSFIWVNIISGLWLGEKITLFKWLGIISIIGGVSLIGYGSSVQKHDTTTKIGDVL